jgi:predicted enzyme related to lactoylglutathione lyase
MPTRKDPWPAGTPCWIDLAVPDVAAATEFYGPVTGWTFVDSGEEFGHYNIARTNDRAAAAIGPIQEEGQPTAWTVYLASDDADATAKRIADNGGTVLAEPFDVPGNGRMLVALDTCGGAFGVWQAAGTIGTEIYNEPGSLTWTDSRLTDPEAGKAFYSAVFGYTYEPVPGAPDDHATFQVNGEVAGGMGGMMGGPPGVPSHWLAYFSVADVDASVAAAERGGGTVLMRPEDTPFGRMGILTDPFGATFALHGPTVEQQQQFG